MSAALPKRSSRDPLRPLAAAPARPTAVLPRPAAACRIAIVPIMALAALIKTRGEPKRDLDFVEAFAGQGAVSKGLKIQEFRGLSLDLRYDRRMNILTPLGFLLHLDAILRLKPNGIFWAAPPCATWVFFSHGSTGRHQSPQGTGGNWKVQSQNALVLRLLTLSSLARQRGAHFIWEQPSNSVLFSFAPIHTFESERTDVFSITLQMGAFGLLCFKETRLWGTAPYMPALQCRMTKDARRALAKHPAKTETSQRYTDPEGNKKVKGGRELKRTQAYTLEFGNAHACAYHEWLNTAAAGSSTAAAASSTASSSTAAAASSTSSEQPCFLLEATPEEAWYLRDLFDARVTWDDSFLEKEEKQPLRNSERSCSR